MYGVGWKRAGEAVVESTFAVKGVSWCVMFRGVIVGCVGERVVWCGWVRCVGVVGLGGGIYDMDVDGLSIPEGGDD